jgi:hypothetical protein
VVTQEDEESKEPFTLKWVVLFCDDQMLEQFKKYAIIRDYILKRKKRLKLILPINDESNPVNIKTLLI